MGLGFRGLSPYNGESNGKENGNWWNIGIKELKISYHNGYIGYSGFRV